MLLLYPHLGIRKSLGKPLVTDDVRSNSMTRPDNLPAPPTHRISTSLNTSTLFTIFMPNRSNNLMLGMLESEMRTTREGRGMGS